MSLIKTLFNRCIVQVQPRKCSYIAEMFLKVDSNKNMLIIYVLFIKNCYVNLDKESRTMLTLL